MTTSYLRLVSVACILSLGACAQGMEPLAHNGQTLSTGTSSATSATTASASTAAASPPSEDTESTSSPETGLGTGGALGSQDANSSDFEPVAGQLSVDDAAASDTSTTTAASAQSLSVSTSTDPSTVPDQTTSEATDTPDSDVSSQPPPDSTGQGATAQSDSQGCSVTCDNLCLPFGITNCCVNDHCGCTWAPGIYCL